MAKHRYISLLRWKRGEQVGLLNVTDPTRVGLTALIVLEPDQYKEKKATAKTEARVPAEAFCNDAKLILGTRPFMLYAAGLGDGTGQHPLIDVYRAARDIGLSIVPSVRLDDPENYLQAVEVVGSLESGVGLRVDLQEMTSAQSWVDGWRFPLSSTDLIIDLANNVGTVVDLGSAAIDAFARLHRGGDWRSVTLVGSSIPDDFSGFAAGLHLLPRAELALWRKLQLWGLPYKLDFGDYATVSPNARTPGVRWGYPINVKYTLRDDFLICRGVRTIGPNGVDMGPQLIGHAKKIVTHPRREAISYCWGDTKIDQIASGDQSPGGLTEWVQYSVNRHIELTLAQLA